MTKKNFDITGKKKEQDSESVSRKMDSFIDGSEPVTTMTVQVPQRLKLSLKREALDKNTTVRKLLIELLEAHFGNNGNK